MVENAAVHFAVAVKNNCFILTTLESKIDIFLFH